MSLIFLHKGATVTMCNKNTILSSNIILDLLIIYLVIPILIGLCILLAVLSICDYQNKIKNVKKFKKTQIVGVI